MAQRLWMGSMILLDMLHAKANRVVLEKISIVRLRACCAPAVMLGRRIMKVAIKCMKGTDLNGSGAHLSASSRITNLWRPGGRVTFFCANPLILFRTTSIPLRRSTGGEDVE